MFSKNFTVGLLSLCFLAACAKDGPAPSYVSGSAPEAQSQGQIKAPPQAPVPMPNVTVSGVSVLIETPENQKSFLKRHADSNRNVPAKIFELRDFKRTLEKTDLKLKIRISSAAFAADDVVVELFTSGEKIESDEATLEGRSSMDLELEFTTPKLTHEDRKVGYKDVSYDLVVSSGTKKARIPFSFAIYDSSAPTYVQPRKGECVIYNAPERASGCYQNRTRSTQEVVFNDSTTRHHEVDVQFSGSVSIAPSIVTISLGVATTEINSTEIGRGSEIHFTNCIECASLIFRQEVETIRKGDVFEVRADGSLNWVGDTTARNRQVAYEFASTGSESNNYDCNISSQLPVGASPECKSY